MAEGAEVVALFVGWVTIMFGGGYFAFTLWAFLVNKIGRHVMISSDLIRAAYQIRQKRQTKNLCRLCGCRKEQCVCHTVSDTVTGDAEVLPASEKRDVSPHG